MPKKSSCLKQNPRIGDGVSIRVRFASHKQIELVKLAASRRGLGFNRYVQCVLQAVSEQVMVVPLATSLDDVCAAANFQSE